MAVRAIPASARHRRTARRLPNWIQIMFWRAATFIQLLAWVDIKMHKAVEAVIRIRGMAETRRCGAVAVRSQVITWSSALTLYALYLSRPLPPLPSYQLRPFFLRLGRLSPPLFTLARGIQGCPKIISFDKSTWHPIFEKSLQSSFSLPLGIRTFSQHLLPKNALPSSLLINPKILFPIFLSLQFFTLP